VAILLGFGSSKLWILVFGMSGIRFLHLFSSFMLNYTNLYITS
jgi:hypothetical protein